MMRTPTGIEVETSREPAENERFHLIGIGGAGMSALARWLLSRGKQVSGSDHADSPTLQDLQMRGAQVYASHHASHLGDTTWVVVSDAIHLDNPEVIEAQQRGLPIWRRSQLLGWMLRDYRVIAITGTHGKTTTTGIIARLLEEAGLDPLVLIGGDLPEAISPWQGNLRLGGGKWAVVEACEAYESYLDLEPEIAIITNIEPDHLDYHGSVESLYRSFEKFVSCIKPGGVCLACGDSAVSNLQSSVSGSSVQFLTYGLGETNHLRAAIIRQDVSGTTFTADGMTYALPAVLSGEHNVLNALAAIGTAQSLGIAQEVIQRALNGFHGVKRRMEITGEVAGMTLIDDYAHHPTEISATINALRQRYPNRRLVITFQPHLYSRTRDQLKGFIESLSASDVVIITDIYPAREDPIPGVSAALIAEGLLERGHPAVYYVPVKTQVPHLLLRIAERDDVLVMMGAGDVDWVARETLKRIETRAVTHRLRVAVLMGGDSSEREVSILSGRRVLEGLNSEEYDTFAVDPALLTSRPDQLGLVDLLTTIQPDVAFIALHGRHGEDGAVQGLLELAGIPYTGSGMLASALAMNKRAAKIVMQAAGLKTPEGILIEQGDEEAVDKVRAVLELPIVVKPNEGGSTLGLSKVYDWADLPRALARAFVYDHAALVERMIPGMEISVPVLGNRYPVSLPVVEIVPQSGFYDFKSKYVPGATEEVVPARLPDELMSKAQRASITAHQAIGCRGMSRVDMIVHGEDLYVLEVNTVPGLTPTSLFPRSALAAGIGFQELIERLIELAREN